MQISVSFPSAKTSLVFCLLAGLGGFIAPGQAIAENAAPLYGAIAGIVRNSAQAPVAGALVTAMRADGQGIWTTISGSDGRLIPDPEHDAG